MIPEGFEKLKGNWSGFNKLYMMPEDPVRESKSTASIDTVAKGQTLRIEYTWEFDGAEKDGIILLTSPKESPEVTMVWTDAFHMEHSFMVCKGEFNGSEINVKGSYQIGDYPEWYWRTIFTCDDVFAFKMYNISPEGEEFIAVDSSFERV